MENFDLLFSQVNEIGMVQQPMKPQMDIRGAAVDQYTAEQHMIAQQVKANGAAVAQLTMRQFDHEAHFDDDSAGSMVDEEPESFENVSAKNKGTHRPVPSKKPKPPPKTVKKPSLPTQSMPKMQFPKFDGENPQIGRDNCESYFELYQLPEGMWRTAAHIHFEGNAAKWYQAYKQNLTFKSWEQFCAVVEEECGSDDFRAAICWNSGKQEQWKTTLLNSKLCSLISQCTTLTTMICSSHLSILWA